MGSRVEIVPATETHASELAARMRPADRLEVEASGGYSPLGAVLASLEAGPGYSILIDGEVAAIYGVAPAGGGILTGRSGVIWLLTSDAVDRHRVAFWKVVRRELPRLFDESDILINAVDARYEQALRLTRRLGFSVGPARSFGAQGQPFHPISLTREALHV